jgi:quercetin dioxygenase-like cupin family protein
MPDWTKTNFDDLPDVSPEGAHLDWRFAREALGSPELGVSRFTYEPGARMPWGHRHRVQEEAYVVVAGSGRAKLDDEVVELSLWDVLRVAPSVARSFEAGPDGPRSSASAAGSPTKATTCGSTTSGTERSRPRKAERPEQDSNLRPTPWEATEGAGLKGKPWCGRTRISCSGALCGRAGVAFVSRSCSGVCTRFVYLVLWRES